jgi:hypothetical protein
VADPADPTDLKSPTGAMSVPRGLDPEVMEDIATPVGNEDEDDFGPYSFEEHEDGSVTIYEESEASGPAVDGSDFDANLALVMDETERRQLALRLLDDVDRWTKEREPHDKKFEEGIKRTGLGEKAPGGAGFSGASEVTHPVILKCAVDFQSSVMKELYPPNGPVKIFVPGKMTPPKRKKAERKRDHMNWQLTENIEEYRPELETLLMQLPIIGDGYHKPYWDVNLGRPAIEYVSADKILNPFHAKSFYSSDFAHWQEFTEEEVLDREESGEWLDLAAPSPSLFPERSNTSQAMDRVEGKEETGVNEYGVRTCYEIYTMASRFDFDTRTDGAPAPYIIMVDEASSEIRSIRRNWVRKDRLRRRLDHVVQYKFFPWVGTKGVGLIHFIGGLSAAATGSLRALLDTAHINNFPSLLKLKSKIGGQNIQLEATGVTEIEGSTPTDDIRKLVMPVPFNPPSEVLFKLLGFLTEEAESLVSTAEERIADSTNNGPVGTTLALIEQGSKTYHNIHSRMHYSQKKTLSILHRLNSMYLDERVEIEELGDLIVYRKDYEGPMDVVPVSDPNIFCESQRYAQLQAVRTMKQEDPDLFNRRALAKRSLEQLRVPDYEELLVPEPDHRHANPVAENIAMAMGRPAMAFPDQDHVAHVQVLVQFMMDTNFGSSPIIAPKYMSMALAHLHDHVVLWYGQNMYDALKQITGSRGMKLEEIMMEKALQPKIDKILAMSATEVHAAMGKVMTPNIPPVIQHAMQLIQQYTPKPQDPMSLEVQRKSSRDQAEIGLKKAGMQQKGQQAATDDQTDKARLVVASQEVGVQRDIAQQKNATELQRTSMDNSTALAVAAISAAKGESSGVKDGEGLG